LGHASAQRHPKLSRCENKWFGVCLSPYWSNTYSDTVRDRGDPGCLHSWVSFAILGGLGLPCHRGLQRDTLLVEHQAGKSELAPVSEKELRLK